MERTLNIIELDIKIVHAQLAFENALVGTDDKIIKEAATTLSNAKKQYDEEVESIKMLEKNQKMMKTLSNQIQGYVSLRFDTKFGT